MPICLTAWTIEDFETVPRGLVEKNRVILLHDLMNSLKFLNPKCNNIAVKERHDQV